MRHAVYPVCRAFFAHIPLMSRPSVRFMLPVLRGYSPAPDYENDPEYIRDLSALMALDYSEKVLSATAGR